MKASLRHFFSDFLKCGLTGWCMEILFTSLNALRRRDLTLKGSTSIWMFPIYGSAAFFGPLSRLLKKKPVFLRGLLYMLLIFTMEHFSGKLLSKKKLCPWDYGHSRWNIHRLIRLDYAPLWFLAGLFFEQLLKISQRSDIAPS